MSSARAGCVARRSSARPPSKHSAVKPGAIVTPKNDHAPPGTTSPACHDAGRDDVLDRVAGERIAEDHLLVGAVGVQQDEPERVAGVEVPDLVEREPVEERAARRVDAEEPDAGGADRAVAVALVRSGRSARRYVDSTGSGAHAEAVDEGSGGRVDGSEATAG